MYYTLDHKGSLQGSAGDDFTAFHLSEDVEIWSCFLVREIDCADEYVLLTLQGKKSL